MSKLPTINRSAEAVAYVRAQREWFETNRINFFGVDVCMLDPDDTLRLGKQCLIIKAMCSADDMMDVVHDAREGWGLAREALQGLIREFVNNRTEMPTYLAAYAMDVIGNRLKPEITGAKRNADYFRNMVICLLVSEVREKFGFKPTRAPYSTKPNGCCIVAGGFDMSESRVRQLWRTIGKPNFG
jgi:hypothetical protein